MTEIALLVIAAFLLGCLLSYLLETHQRKVDVNVKVKNVPVDKLLETPTSMHDMRVRALNMAQRVHLGARRVTGSLGRCEGHIDDATTLTRRCTSPHKEDTLGSLKLASSEAHYAKASMANVEVGTKLIPDMLDTTKLHALTSQT